MRTIKQPDKLPGDRQFIKKASKPDQRKLFFKGAGLLLRNKVFKI